ncbi:hypothetical protein E3N88_11039 [Mikania micrantha]|uniref:RRM domain-containing protein n=1 Tax=Mikania micrantha TaxID=192012 RepID=A0A5N6PDD5_9ASTR|nr:hypothetical protein E3N88_11039 [Mikania micrantha]
MSYSRRSRYSPSPSPPHKRYSRSVSKSRSRSRSRSYDASDIENPGNSLYVTGLSRRVTKKDLEKHFSEEGKVEDVRLVIDPWTRESRGFGFVSMSSIKDADRCVKYLDGSVLEGRVITVEKVNGFDYLVFLAFACVLISWFTCQEEKRAHPHSRKVPWTEDRICQLSVACWLKQVVVGPLRILLIQEAALLVTHPKETVAGPGPAHTLHTTEGAHTRVLPLRTVDEGPTLHRHMITVGDAIIPDLTVQKTVTTGGEVVTTLGTIHQITEGQAGVIHPQTTGGTTHLSIGDGADVIGVVLQGSATITGATADDIVVFLEACLLLQGGIT